MIAANTEPTPTKHRKPCRSCEASAAGCDSIKWLRGSYCCPKCSGWHDEPEYDDAA